VLSGKRNTVKEEQADGRASFSKALQLFSTANMMFWPPS